ncbi:MAG: hypothetical protein E7158_02000 [Firmicutes bacterium]|nr:hypothetical protein [Bacillota bacterium]
METINKNESNLQSIIKNYEIDPYMTLLFLEDYIEKNRNDENALLSYISLLITVGRFEDALYCIKSIEDSLSLTNNIYKHIVYLKLKVMMYMGDYERALDIIDNAYKFLQSMINDIGYYKVYCEQRVYKNKDKNEYDNYIVKQFIDYSFADFIMYCKNLYCKKSEIEFFDCESMKILLVEINKLLPNKECLHKGFIEDNYYFKYDNCAIVNGVSVDYFTVITLHESANILMMYPQEKIYNLPYTDLNYLRENKQEVVYVKEKL